MTIKILASGDNHFNQSSRFAECIRVHENKVVIAKRENIDLYLDGGDVYEKASTPTERKAVSEWLTAMAEVCPVVITKGNHDRQNELNLLAKLKTKHPIIVIDTPQVVRVAGVTIGAVPWPDYSEVLKSAQSTGATESEIVRAAMRAIFMGLGSEMDKYDGPRVGLGHLMVDGAKTSHGHILQGQPINLGTDDLALMRADVGFMSHIHKKQEFQPSMGGPWYYTGSPYRDTFGQTEDKTLRLVEFDGNKLIDSREIDSGATPMIDVAGEWSGEEQTIVVDADEEKIRGAEVRFQYKVPFADKTQAKAQAEDFRRAFKEQGAVYVKVEEDVEVVKRTKIPALSKATTIDEKLDARWKSIEFDPADRREPLLSKAFHLEELAGKASIAPTWMRVHSYESHGILPREEPFRVDFSTYQEGSIIAVTGKNGTGKTRFVESMMGGACHRDMPTHGKLSNKGEMTGAYLQVCATAGDETWTIRHGLTPKDVTSMVAKGETPDDWKKVPREDMGFQGSKVTDFDSWSQRNLPCKSALYGTQVAAQQVGKSRVRMVHQSSAERTDTLLEVIGLKRWATMATQARAYEVEASQALEEAIRELNDEKERVGDIDALRLAVTEAQGAEKQQEAALVALSENLKAAEQELKDIAVDEAAKVIKRKRRAEIELEAASEKEAAKEALSEIAVLEALNGSREADKALVLALPQLRVDLSRVDELEASAKKIKDANEVTVERIARFEKEERAVSESIGKLSERLIETRELISRKGEIEKADSDVKLCREELEGLNEERRRFLDEKSSAEKELAVARVGLESAETEKRRLDAEAADKDAITVAVSELPALQLALDESKAKQGKAELTLEELRGRTVAGAEERIAGLRDGLTDVLAAESTPVSYDIATAALKKDDQTVYDAAELPQLIKAAKLELASAIVSAGEADEAFRKCEELAKKKANLDQALTALEKIQSTIEELRRPIEGHEKAVAVADSRLIDIKTLRERLIEKGKSLATTAGDLSALQAAEAVHGEIQPQIDGAMSRANSIAGDIQTEREALRDVPDCPCEETLKTSIAEAEAAEAREAKRATSDVAIESLTAAKKAHEGKAQSLAVSLLDFGDLAPLSPELDLAASQEALNAGTVALTEAQAVTVRANAAVESAEAKQGKIKELCDKRDKLALDQSDWTRLAFDLGRKGIQADEVDSAGPELTAHCNRILRKCHGTRFTISIEPDRLSEDGKRQISEFMINVYDSETGKTRDASLFSGGESSILAEAVEGGLLILGCSKSDAKNPTLVRDEATAAVDEESLPVIYDMWELESAEVNAAHMIVISHDSYITSRCGSNVIRMSKAERKEELSLEHEEAEVAA